MERDGGMSQQQASAVSYAVDLFPCGCAVTNTHGTILSFNEYLWKKFGLNKTDLSGANISTILTKASRIFFESYAIPLLTRDGCIEELQFSLRNGDGDAVPVLVNARRCAKDGIVYWSLLQTIRHDQLFQELVNARRALEDRADELRTYAKTDSLTGLLTRGELDQHAERVLMDARTFGAPLSLLFIDIDYFKEVNDQFGHATGDRILTQLGAILKHESRDGDFAFRYGGEELVLLLTNTTTEEAQKVASRLHERLRTLDSEDPAITISIGIATSDGAHTREYSDLLALADRSLYQAKRDGRNRTVVFRT